MLPKMYGKWHCQLQREQESYKKQGIRDIAKQCRKIHLQQPVNFEHDIGVPQQGEKCIMDIKRQQQRDCKDYGIKQYLSVTRQVLSASYDFSAQQKYAIYYQADI